MPKFHHQSDDQKIAYVFGRLIAISAEVKDLAGMLGAIANAPPPPPSDLRKPNGIHLTQTGKDWLGQIFCGWPDLTDVEVAQMSGISTKHVAGYRKGWLATQNQPEAEATQ